LRLSLIAFCFSLCLGIFTNAFAQFPVQRAEQEFVALIPFVVGWGHQNQGNEELFKRWTLPYAPLYLEVRYTLDHQEASNLCNFYLGIAAGAFKIDSAALTDNFHCGPDCTKYRRSDIESKLAQLDELVQKFRNMPNVKLLANWGIDDDFRINDLYRIMGQQRITRPSPIMGFVPSSVWEPVDDVDRYIKSIGEKPKDVYGILKIMRELSIAAIVRETNGLTRVIRVGISDNESGLLFTIIDKPPYMIGDKIRDGRKIQLIEKVKSNVYFYETT
jgi:hypothetical protein